MCCVFQVSAAWNIACMGDNSSAKKSKNTYSVLPITLIKIIVPASLLDISEVREEALRILPSSAHTCPTISKKTWFRLPVYSLTASSSYLVHVCEWGRLTSNASYMKEKPQLRIPYNGSHSIVRQKRMRGSTVSPESWSSKHENFTHVGIKKCQLWITKRKLCCLIRKRT